MEEKEIEAKRLEAAEKYVNARAYPQKGESREAYDTRMLYEIRYLLIEAHMDGQEVSERARALMAKGER